MVLASLISSKHFNSNIDKLAMSLLGYIIDSSHVNNIVRLVLLIIMAYNERYNPIIFNIILPLLTHLLKRYHSLVVPLYSSNKD